MWLDLVDPEPKLIFFLGGVCVWRAGIFSLRFLSSAAFLNLGFEPEPGKMGNGASVRRGISPSLLLGRVPVVLVF